MEQEEISGSHGGEYEDDSLLGYSALLFVEVVRRFRVASSHHRRPDNGGSTS
jgi:hypothetical protein